ncbi:melanopsin-like [Clytia hemisphaerica]|uniref:melanopsin-like n=1 Tax=Clytia hemisphaerica TaxID=252671 RepID=UPI0034D4A424
MQNDSIRNRTHKRNMDGFRSAMTPTLAAIATPLFVLSAMAAAFGNLFCLLVLWQPSQRSTSNIILTSLTLSDSLVGFICFPLVIWRMNIYQNPEMARWAHYSYGLTTLWIGSSSVCTIVFIAYDRYIHITKPNKYHDILPKRKAVIIVLSIWFFALVFGLCCMLFSGLYVTLFPLFYFASTIIICVSYYLIWKAAKESQRRIAFNTVCNRQRQRVQNRLVKKVLLLIAIYLVVITHSFAYVILSIIAVKRPDLLSIDFMVYAQVISMYVALSNSWMNLPVYVWRDPDFTAACKRLIRSLGLRARRTEAIVHMQ